MTDLTYKNIYEEADRRLGLARLLLESAQREHNKLKCEHDEALNVLVHCEERIKELKNQVERLTPELVELGGPDD